MEHCSKSNTAAAEFESSEKSNLLLGSYLEIILRAEDPEEGLRDVLSQLGEDSRGDRVYIFELCGTQYFKNSWEWCRQGIRSQKEFLQHVKCSDIRTWFQLFQNRESVIIPDVEKIRAEDPIVYTYLKPQQIHSLIAGRIYQGDQITGFVGIDNPDPEMVPLIEPILAQLGRIAGTQIMRLQIRRELEEMDLRDPETRLYNQKALFRHALFDQNSRTMGVIYGRLNQDLSAVPSSKIHGACDSLSDMLETGRLYRISPTEFLAVYINISEDRLNNLRRKVKFSNPFVENKVSIGSAWTDENPIMDDLLQKAKRWSYLCGDDNQKSSDLKDPLYRYLLKSHFDLSFLLKALTIENESGFFFFGDIQNNVYYVSDNMARKFGLSGNILQDLPQFWLERIKGQKAKERFSSELQEILAKKQDQLDLYHQVHTCDGHMEWVRCFGMTKWNKERSVPLFCAGRLMMQDVSLLVDCNTNFSEETVLCRNLSKLKEEGGDTRIIGFSLNDIAKVNNMQGRAFGDSLIHSAADALSNQLADKLAFYKLSGMRFAAVVRSGFREDYRNLIAMMRSVIEEKYHTYGIEVPNPCSFTLLDFPIPSVGTLDFIEDLNSCIKLSQQEIAVPFVDGRNLNIRKIQHTSNLALALGRDVLNQMENFRLVIQPVVSAKSGEVVAGEALLRWRNDGKNVPPDQFIPILEHENMIQAVGRWVFEESVMVCRRIVSFQPDFHLSVNVSLQQLDDDGFLEFISHTLSKYDLNGRHIFLEITESCMDREQEKLMHFVNYCENLGIKVALDDFGTGYSSIRVLMQYPTAIIKLDRSLLLEMGKSADKLNFISSIVFACHQFGKQVCIEGVETEDQCEMVRRADCDLIQGFYYFRPMEIEDIFRMLTQLGSILPETF